MHALDEEGALSVVREHSYRTILLEVPEGVRDRAAVLADRIRQETRCVAIVWGGTCWGPCDLHEHEAAPLVDAVLHFGHTPLPGGERPVPVHFLSIEYEGGLPNDLVADLRERLGDRPAALISTVQYLPLLPRLREALDDVVIPQGALAPGQVSGCDQSAAVAAPEDRVLVYLGTGRFHPLGAALATGRPVLVLDLELGMVEEVGRKEAERFQRKRNAAIAREHDARKCGEYISTKSGQGRRDRAIGLLEAVEGAGREAILIAMDDVSPAALLPFHLEALVSCACPRVAVDDGMNYPFPVLTPDEAEIALGLRTYDDWTPPFRGPG